MPSWQRPSAEMKKQRSSRSQPRDLNGQRGSIAISVPGADGVPAKSVLCVRPVYTNEDLRIQLDEQTIDHVIKFVASKGFDDDLKTSPRDPT